MKKLITYISICFIFISCSSPKNIVKNTGSLAQEINSDINKNHQVGFVLKDLSDNKIIFSQDGDKKFTAASNIKLFTFYAGLSFLKDSIPSLQYTVHKDSLIIWPMADPTFLHNKFKVQRSFNFLKNSKKDIYLITNRYKGSKYGKGWSWDDYNENYQTEITDLPMYGNVISAKVDNNGNLNLKPDLTNLYFSEIDKNVAYKKISKEYSNNNLHVPLVLTANLSQEIPINFTNNIKENLLTDTLLATGVATTSVIALPWKEVPSDATKIYNGKTDDVYKLLLKNSDNFLAEHLLINIAAENNFEMQTSTVINKTLELLPEIKKEDLIWVDASGLSRYNLVSPNNMVTLLDNIRNKINNDDKLFSLLPTGGKEGTLKNMFKNQTSPFVFAKSGSMSNTYNLSGYLIGKSGKKYSFSYLNNNFTTDSTIIKNEVERILNYVYEHY